MLRLAKLRYNEHRGNAYQAGNEFLLTFEDWWKIWQESGRWEERGPYKGQYVMARFGDKGAYEVGNVKIITAEENRRELQFSVETRRKMSGSQKRVRSTPEMRAKLSAGAMGNKFALGSQRTLGERARISEFMKGNDYRLGKPASLETRAIMSASLKGNNRSLGHKHTLEARANMSASKIGKAHSAETRSKIALSQKRRWAKVRLCPGS